MRRAQWVVMRLLALSVSLLTVSACAPGLSAWSDAPLLVRARTSSGRCQVEVVFGPTGPDFATSGVRARINGKEAWWQMQGEAAHQGFNVTTGNSFPVGATGFFAQSELEAELDAAETLEVVLDDGAAQVRMSLHNVCKLNQFTLDGDAARQYRAGERFTLIAHPSASWANNPMVFTFSDLSTQTVPLVDGRAELTVPANLRNTNLLVWTEDSAALPTPTLCEGAGSCSVAPVADHKNHAPVSVFLAQ